MIIAFSPSAKIFLKNKLFNPSFDRDNIREPFVFLKEYCDEQKWDLNTIDIYPDLSKIDIIIAVRFDLNINLILKLIKANPKVRIIYLVTEEKNIVPLHNNKFLHNPLFDIVLTWDDRIVDDKYFIKYCYMNPFREMVTPTPFNEKKFLCMIYSYKTRGKDKKRNIYPERFKIIDQFGTKGKIDIYGIGWEKASDELIKKNYKGKVKSKVETLKHYKFAIAFENSKSEVGGICEKIFDVMAAGCVPIYWGAPNVLDYIPETCFIDYRKFANCSELERYLLEMKEGEYNAYLEEISSFLKSKDYLPFTSYGFLDKIAYAINTVKLLPPTSKSIYRIKVFFLIKIIANLTLFWKYHKSFAFDVIFK